MSICGTWPRALEWVLQQDLILSAKMVLGRLLTACASADTESYLL